MTAADSLSVLQRMATVAPPIVAEVPLTAARAVKLALTRAAEQSIKLIISVETITEETKAFDPLMAALNDDMVLLWLDEGDEHRGVLAFDKEMSAGIVEMRTLGRVREAQGPDRRQTAADISLAAPVFTTLLAQLEQTTSATVLDGWTAGVKIGERVESVRAISLALPENTFRYMAVQVDLGAGERKGMMWIALPDAQAAPIAASDPVDVADWAKEMEETVMEAPVVLEAILHRSKFPLSLLAELSVGQEIPLPGCRVSSVKLESLDHAIVARGRIGQMAGNIAVRIEAPAETPMTDLASFGEEGGISNELAALPDEGMDALAQDDVPLGDFPMDDAPLGDMPMGDAPLGDFPTAEIAATETPDAFDPAPMSADVPQADNPPISEAPDFPMDDMPDFPMADFPDIPSEET